jgi:hypothetical protein
MIGPFTRSWPVLSQIAIYLKPTYRDGVALPEYLFQENHHG